MIHESQNCPMYLAENGQWSSTMSPYCSCKKDIYYISKNNTKVIYNKETANNINCIAPEHSWKYNMQATCENWVCENCGIRSY